MKRKEREHLKEDPFAVFIETVIQKFSDLKKEILTIIAIIIFIGIIVGAVLLIRSSSISKENGLFAKALEIKNSSFLTNDQKIEQLSKIDSGKGISATINFYIATIHFNEGQFKKAKEILENSPESSIQYINDEKKLLKSEIFMALGEKSEAIKLLKQVLFEGNSKVPKDFILLKIAKYEIIQNNKPSALENLKKLIEEYPDSIYSRDARKMISSME